MNLYSIKNIKKLKWSLIRKKSTQIFTIIPREDPQCICLSVNLMKSVFRTGNNYYSQVFLEECKYVAKKKKMPNYIIDHIETSSSQLEIRLNAFRRSTISQNQFIIINSSSSIFLRKKSKSNLSIWQIIIQRIKNNFWVPS